MALVPASRVPWALEGPASGSLLRWGISLVSQWLEPRSFKQHEKDVQTKAQGAANYGWGANPALNADPGL